MNMPDGPLTTALVRTALALADAAVICDIECEGTPVGPPSARRWNVAAMFNPAEHSPEFCDMAEQGIAYGVARGLLCIEPGVPHTVRILKGLPS